MRKIDKLKRYLRRIGNMMAHTTNLILELEELREKYGDELYLKAVEETYEIKMALPLFMGAVRSIVEGRKASTQETKEVKG